MSIMRSRPPLRRPALAMLSAALSLTTASPALAQCDPEFLSHTGGTPSAIFASGNRGYLGFAGGLRVINTANPAAPILLGETVLPGQAGRMALLSGHLYIAMDDAGVAVVDVSTPATPTLLTTISGAKSTHVAAAGGLLFIIRDGELKVYDVAVPAAPVLRSTYSLGSTDLAGVAAAGSTVYVVTSQDEVHTLSLANPAAPAVLGIYTMTTSSFNEDLALRGNLLAALTWDGAELIDVANPAAPVYRGFAPSDSISDFLAFGQSGGATMLYLEGASCEVYAYDVTNPVIPIRRAEIPNVCFPRVAASGPTLFIADSDGVEVFDFTIPTAYQQVHTSTPLPDFSQGLVTIDQHAAVLSAPNLLLIYDLSNPSAPQLVHTHTLGGLGHEIVKVGRIAYIAEYITGFLPDTPGRLEVLDLTNPIAPVLLGSFDTQRYLLELDVQDARAVTTDGDGTLEVFDVSNPAAILRLGHLADAGRGRVFLAADHALIGDFHDGARVIDLSNPAAPVLVATHAPRPGQYLEDLVVRGTTAFALQSDDRIDILDIADPVNPVFQSSISTSDFFTSMGTAGSLLAISVGGDKLRFIDTSDPASPVLLPIEPIGGFVSRFAIAGETLWATGSSDGLFGVHVPSVPRLRQWPADAAACPGGDPVEFSVRLDNPAGATFQWLHAGSPIANGVTAGGAIVSGATTRDLTITTPGLTDLGLYACTITNGCGTITSAPARLSLALPPAVLNQPDAQTACYRASAIFQTAGLGSAPFTFQWQRETPAGSGIFLPLTDGPATNHTVSGSATRTLTISPLAGRTLPDAVATRYRCIIANTCDTVTTLPASLAVCRSDYNCTGDVSVQDLFDFLDDWFIADAKANFNGVGAVTVQDLFDFLDSWFLGC